MEDGGLASGPLAYCRRRDRTFHPKVREKDGESMEQLPISSQDLLARWDRQIRRNPRQQAGQEELKGSPVHGCRGMSHVSQFIFRLALANGFVFT